VADKGYRRQSWYLISCSDQRQWRRVSIPVASSLQDGENPHGDGNTTAAREGADMAVWFKRRLQCLLCEESALFDAEIAPAPDAREHQQMTVETTCCAREDERMR
jgi:hypothetical protein